MKAIVCFVLLVTPFLFSAQNKKCNYIEDYYPLIYRGQLSFLKKDNNSAYHYLKKAEEKCDLLYSPFTREIETLAVLETKKGNFDESIRYLELLLKNGIPFSSFENNEDYNSLKSYNKWKMLKQESKSIYDSWYSNLNLELRKEILTMQEEDQKIRWGKVSMQEMSKVDLKIENRFKEIFKDYGYPGFNLIGNWTIDKKYQNFLMFAVHFMDIEYFKPLFFDFVKNGKSDPQLYAFLIDAHDRKNKIYTYRIYGGIKDEQVADIKNLDKRRVSVGLRPWKMQLEYELLTRN